MNQKDSEQALAGTLLEQARVQARAGDAESALKFVRAYVELSSWLKESRDLT